MPAIYDTLIWLGLNFHCECTSCGSEFGSDEMDAKNPNKRWDVCPRCQSEGTVKFAMYKDMETLDCADGSDGV